MDNIVSNQKVKKQVITADVTSGSIVYKSGVMRGARKMFYVQNRAVVYVKGPLPENMYERLTLDLMRRVASIGLPVSELRKVSK